MSNNPVNTPTFVAKAEISQDAAQILAALQPGIPTQDLSSADAFWLTEYKSGFDEFHTFGQVTAFAGGVRTTAFTVHFHTPV